MENKNKMFYQEKVFGFEISVDDSEGVEVVEREGQLCEVELDVLLGEHHLLRQASEQVAAAKEVQNEVKLALGLKKRKKFGLKLD